MNELIEIAVLGMVALPIICLWVYVFCAIIDIINRD